MFHDPTVALVGQVSQDAGQGAGIARMEPDRGFVQHTGADRDRTS